MRVWDDGAADADGEDVWAETVGASIRSRDESASARRGMSLNRLTTSPPSVPETGFLGRCRARFRLRPWGPSRHCGHD